MAKKAIRYTRGTARLFGWWISLMLQSVADLLAHASRHADSARLGQRLETRGNVDAVARRAEDTAAVTTDSRRGSGLSGQPA